MTACKTVSWYLLLGQNSGNHVVLRNPNHVSHYFGRCCVVSRDHPCAKALSLQTSDDVPCFRPQWICHSKHCNDGEYSGGQCRFEMVVRIVLVKTRDANCQKNHTLTLRLPPIQCGSMELGDTSRMLFHPFLIAYY